MARADGSVASNPKYIGGNSPMGNPLTTTYPAAASGTWIRGEFGNLNAGLVRPNSTTTGAKVTTHQFCQDQSTSTSASQEVDVMEIQRGARFEIFVTSNGTDSAIGNANLGTRYGVYTKSNVAYLDLNDSASGCDFKVIKLAQDYEPLKNAAADTPGKCIVEFDPLA